MRAEGQEDRDVFKARSFSASFSFSTPLMAFADKDEESQVKVEKRR